jgi:hypothetical protein
MRQFLWTIVVGAAVTATAGTARAQLYGQMVGQSGLAPYYQAPGNFSTTWGVPSFGIPRTYSQFASPYGAGYGFGYYPYTVLPGYYGARLWRPGFAVPGYFYGAGYYGTVSTPYRPLTNGMAVPFGYYAPGFGPPSFYAW